MSAEIVEELTDIVEHNEEDAGDGFLTFQLAGEEYGVDILKVQEIRGWEQVTRVPNQDTHLKGVLNLRGAIVPIVCLRERFGLDDQDYTPTTVVIVLSVQSETKERIIGVVVDSVSDVVNAKQSDVQGTPDFGTAIDTEFISGLIEHHNQMIMLLDVDRLLHIEDAENELE